MTDENGSLNRSPRDIRVCATIMRKHTNLSDRHVVNFRSSTEQYSFEEKMRRVSVDMINYYYRRMDSDTKARARKTLEVLTAQQ